MRVIKLLILGCLVLFGFSIKAQVKVLETRVEFLKNPVGIDSKQPRLSWQLRGIGKNVLQTAYEIRVGKDATALRTNKQLIWKTEKVSSNESLHQIYAGEPLIYGQKYFWQVRVWDNKGIPSEWSEVASWQMGLLNTEDWKAKWIGLDVNYIEPADDHRRLPARMVRKEFNLDKTVKYATVYMSGLGFSELYLNGSKVDNRIMDPTHSFYDKRVMYVAHDVTKYLKSGKNAIGVILGNGRFFSPRIRIPVETPSFGFPKMLMQMEIKYSDGTSELIISDEKWKITDKGPIRSNSEFDGEEYDANMEQKDWDKAGFDDSKWQPVQLVLPPGGNLIAQMHEPMRVIEKLKPVSIYNSKSGGYVVDFGQNLYGMCKIKVKGPKGTRVVIRTTFDLDSTGNVDMAPNRSALSTDIYTLKGKGVEVWAPRFRGQGMRYAEIIGWPGVLKKDDIEFLVVHSDLTKVGDFTCSNDLVNKIYANMVRSVRMQERGVPMDPDRDERQAWLGVSQMTSETEGYMYNVAAFHESFLGESRIDQREDGCISDAGSLWHWAYTKDPYVPADVILIPWSSYNMYGDKRILEDNYEMMKRWVLYLEKNVDPDLIYRKGSYSDWVDAYTMDEKVAPPFGATSRELLSTAYYYYDLKMVEKTAKLLNKTEDADYFRVEAQKVGEAFNNAFLDTKTGVYLNNTQAAYAIAFEFGLVPEDYKKKVADRFVQNILVEHNGHLSVGNPGIKWLFQSLTHIGRTDVAYTILTQTTRPGWGYMVKKGGTSIWERWDTDTQTPGMNGQSQTILAGYLGAWMYQTLGGIAYDPEYPGFKRIIMRPEPVGDLKWVNVSFKSLYGLIKSDWKCENELFTWKVTVPTNCTATVYIPTNYVGSVKESGKKIEKNVDVKFIRIEKNAVIYEIGSGDYEFSSHYSLSLK
ncbi:MAG: family 78 glycoside hydrolase catalytic domain [Bacteroidales bacterium]